MDRESPVPNEQNDGGYANADNFAKPGTPIPYLEEENNENLEEKTFSGEEGQNFPNQEEFRNPGTPIPYLDVEYSNNLEKDGIPLPFPNQNTSLDAVNSDKKDVSINDLDLGNKTGINLDNFFLQKNSASKKKINFGEISTKLTEKKIPSAGIDLSPKSRINFEEITSKIGIGSPPKRRTNFGGPSPIKTDQKSVSIGIDLSPKRINFGSLPSPKSEKKTAPKSGITFGNTIKLEKKSVTLGGIGTPPKSSINFGEINPTRTEKKSVTLGGIGTPPKSSINFGEINPTRIEKKTVTLGGIGTPPKCGSSHNAIPNRTEKKSVTLGGVGTPPRGVYLDEERLKRASKIRGDAMHGLDHNKQYKQPMGFDPYTVSGDIPDPYLENGTVLTSSIANYVVDSYINKGTSGCVYKAYSTKLGDTEGNKETVAIKIFKNTNYSSEAGKEEFCLLMKIKYEAQKESEHILEVYDGFYYKDHFVIVMELLQESLLEYIQKCPMTPIKIAVFGFNISNAIKCLHSNGYIHGDIKPENVVKGEKVNPETGKIINFVKLIDFSSSITFANAGKIFNITTIFYRAPEVCLRIHYTEKIDTWGFGVLLFEMLTGRPPFYSFDDEYLLLLEMEHMLGPIPQYMLDSSPKSLSLAAKRNSQEYKLKVSREMSYYKCLTLEDYLVEVYNKKFPNVRDKEFYIQKVKLLADLIEKCLIFDPEHRLSFSEIVSHPFFNFADWKK